MFESDEMAEAMRPFLDLVSAHMKAARDFARASAEENLKLREILREYKALRDMPTADSIDSRLVSKMDEAVKELKTLNRGAAGRPTDA